jgi:cytidylate kinase
MLVDKKQKEMKMPNGRLSVIIAAMPSAGKSTLAKKISEELGLEMMVGGDILKAMADQMGYKVTGDDWWETEEGMKFLEQRKTNPQWDKIVDKTFKEALAEGGIVITSWTMPWLSDYGFKIWLNADFETRANRLANRDSLNIEEAKKHLKKRDEENKKIYKTMYGINYGEDFEPFDLVINANIYGPDALAKCVIACLRELNSE